MSSSTPVALTRKISLSDLTEDTWENILSFLSGPHGYDIQAVMFLSMISPHFHDLFVSVASSITVLTPKFFMRFCESGKSHTQGQSQSHMMLAEKFHFSTLFKYTTSLKTAILAHVIPSVVDEVSIRALTKSAFDTLEYIDMSDNSFPDHILEPVLKCPNLHALICRYVKGITGSAFARENVSAPIWTLEITGCEDFTREGLRKIFDLSSIQHLVLDRFYGRAISLRDFIKCDLPSSRLAQTLESLSLQFSDMSTEGVLVVLESMPSLTYLTLHDAITNVRLTSYWVEFLGCDIPLLSQAFLKKYFLDKIKIRAYSIVFPRVTIMLNDKVF